MAVHRKTILITGASSGLGMAMARLYAARGHDLALCARRNGPLQALKDELSTPANRIEIRSLDVTNHEQVFSVFDDLDAVFGGIDRIIVNAGIGDGAPIGAGGFDRNRGVVETNFTAALAQCEAGLRHFRHRDRGHLVLVSSIGAVRGLPGGMAAYAASKAALSHLGEGLSVEFARTPIRITTVLPGYIRTPLNDSAGRLPFEVDVQTGARALVEAIHREPRIARVPSWPWRPLLALLHAAPFWLLRRMVARPRGQMPVASDSQSL